MSFGPCNEANQLEILVFITTFCLLQCLCLCKYPPTKDYLLFVSQKKTIISQTMLSRCAFCVCQTNRISVFEKNMPNNGMWYFFSMLLSVQAFFYINYNQCPSEQIDLYTVPMTKQVLASARLSLVSFLLRVLSIRPRIRRIVLNQISLVSILQRRATLHIILCLGLPSLRYRLFLNGFHLACLRTLKKGIDSIDRGIRLHRLAKQQHSCHFCYYSIHTRKQHLVSQLQTDQRCEHSVYAIFYHQFLAERIVRFLSHLHLVDVAAAKVVMCTLNAGLLAIVVTLFSSSITTSIQGEISREGELLYFYALLNLLQLYLYLD